MKFKKKEDYSLYNDAAAAGVTADEMKALITAQQGEEDAVYLYKRLAKIVRDQADRDAFLRLAGDEARHAEVCKKYTGREVKANPTKGIVVPIMYRVLGQKKVYPIIADAEYKAADKYKHIVSKFHDLETVMNDEVHHGDAVKGLLK